VSADHSAPDQDHVARMDLTQYLEQLALTSSEVAYDQLTGYGFARRYVAGKVVADIGWEVVGLGSHLLAETAESVVGLAGSAEAVELARTAHPAPNAEYKKVDLTQLPYPEGHFDVVVALGVAENLDRSEDLVREAKRVLKQDGVLIISAPDKRFFVDGRNPGGVGYRRGMYASDFQDLLETHFGRVLVYGQGAVAGGFVFPLSGELDAASVESASLSSTNPRIVAEPPTVRSLMAVCGEAEAFEGGESYLMLDRDRRVFDECEDRAEDVDLLRGEIRQMQETEAQAFIDALRLRGTEIAYLRAQIRRSEAQAEAQARRSEAQVRRSEARMRHMENVVREMENSATWRLFEPYRQLRARIDAARGRGRPGGNSEGSGGERPGQ
jgi:SAM-dependent methyltransferase